MRRGYIQVYTGNGKGKTTAALGLALRAAGAGLRVFIAQFIKEKKCSEHMILRQLSDHITIRQFGNGLILRRAPSDADISAAQKGLRKAREIIASGEFDLIILDEVTVAVHYGLISTDDLLDLMAKKPEGMELVLTGRYADRRVLRKADLVTEMKEKKHYSRKGVTSRVGIEK